MITLPPYTKCPACGHNVLTHRRGTCQALVSRESQKRCGCTEIQPPGNTKQMSLNMQEPAK